MGYKLAGIAGVLTAVLGTVIPPFLIIAAVSACYQAFRSNQLVAWMLEGMQAGVGAVIASVTFEMASGIAKEKNKISFVIMAVVFAASVIWQINTIYMILACGLLGILVTFGKRRRKQ